MGSLVTAVREVGKRDGSRREETGLDEIVIAWLVCSWRRSCEGVWKGEERGNC